MIFVWENWKYNILTYSGMVFIYFVWMQLYDSWIIDVNYAVIGVCIQYEICAYVCVKIDDLCLNEFIFSDHICVTSTFFLRMIPVVIMWLCIRARTNLNVLQLCWSLKRFLIILFDTFWLSWLIFYFLLLPEYFLPSFNYLFLRTHNLIGVSSFRVHP